tara:strand:+ start:169 stop:366 length:198 start_codon:yes stop_codon:yes gene_type:complete
MIYHTLADLLYNMKDDYGLSQEAVMNLPIRFSTGKGINNQLLSWYPNKDNEGDHICIDISLGDKS